MKYFGMVFKQKWAVLRYCTHHDYTIEYQSEERIDVQCHGCQRWFSGSPEFTPGWVKTVLKVQALLG